jgi:hypothetical protein
MANFVACKCARDARLGIGVREAGVRAAGPAALYASTEAHVVIRRAADMLGLGSAAVRVVPVDDRQRMRVDALEAAVEADVGVGVVPVAVVATAGTTTTGAIDPLPAVADLASRHGMWFHVDAAYGGGAALAPDLRPLLAGIRQPVGDQDNLHDYFPPCVRCVQPSSAGFLRPRPRCNRSWRKRKSCVRSPGCLTGFCRRNWRVRPELLITGTVRWCLRRPLRLPQPSSGCWPRPW